MEEYRDLYKQNGVLKQKDKRNNDFRKNRKSKRSAVFEINRDLGDFKEDASFKIDITPKRPERKNVIKGKSKNCMDVIKASKTPKGQLRPFIVGVVRHKIHSPPFLHAPVNSELKKKCATPKSFVPKNYQFKPPKGLMVPTKVNPSPIKNFTYFSPKKIKYFSPKKIKNSPFRDISNKKPVIENITVRSKASKFTDSMFQDSIFTPKKIDTTLNILESFQEKFFKNTAEDSPVFGRANVLARAFRESVISKSIVKNSEDDSTVGSTTIDKTTYDDRISLGSVILEAKKSNENNAKILDKSIAKDENEILKNSSASTHKVSEPIYKIPREEKISNNLVITKESDPNDTCIAAFEDKNLSNDEQNQKIGSHKIMKNNSFKESDDLQVTKQIANDSFFNTIFGNSKNELIDSETEKSMNKSLANFSTSDKIASGRDLSKENNLSKLDSNFEEKSLLNTEKDQNIGNQIIMHDMSSITRKNPCDFLCKNPDKEKEVELSRYNSDIDESFNSSITELEASDRNMGASENDSSTEFFSIYRPTYDKKMSTNNIQKDTGIDRSDSAVLAEKIIARDDSILNKIEHQEIIENLSPCTSKSNCSSISINHKSDESNLSKSLLNNSGLNSTAKSNIETAMKNCGSESISESLDKSASDMEAQKNNSSNDLKSLEANLLDVEKDISNEQAYKDINESSFTDVNPDTLQTSHKALNIGDQEKESKINNWCTDQTMQDIVAQETTKTTRPNFIMNSLIDQIDKTECSEKLPMNNVILKERQSEDDITIPARKSKVCNNTFASDRQSLDIIDNHNDNENKLVDSLVNDTVLNSTTESDSVEAAMKNSVNESIADPVDGTTCNDEVVQTNLILSENEIVQITVSEKSTFDDDQDYQTVNKETTEKVCNNSFERICKSVAIFNNSDEVESVDSHLNNTALEDSANSETVKTVIKNIENQLVSEPATETARENNISIPNTIGTENEYFDKDTSAAEKSILINQQNYEINTLKSIDPCTDESTTSSATEPDEVEKFVSVNEIACAKDKTKDNESIEISVSTTIPEKTTLNNFPVEEVEDQKKVKIVSQTILKESHESLGSNNSNSSKILDTEILDNSKNHSLKVNVTINNSIESKNSDEISKPIKNVEIKSINHNNVDDDFFVEEKSIISESEIVPHIEAVEVENDKSKEVEVILDCSISNTPKNVEKLLITSILESSSENKTTDERDKPQKEQNDIRLSSSIKKENGETTTPLSFSKNCKVSLLNEPKHQNSPSASTLLQKYLSKKTPNQQNSSLDTTHKNNSTSNILVDLIDSSTSSLDDHKSPSLKCTNHCLPSNENEVVDLVSDDEEDFSTIFTRVKNKYASCNNTPKNKNEIDKETPVNVPKIYFSPCSSPNGKRSLQSTVNRNIPKLQFSPGQSPSVEKTNVPVLQLSSSRTPESKKNSRAEKMKVPVLQFSPCQSSPLRETSNISLQQFPLNHVSQQQYPSDLTSESTKGDIKIDSMIVDKPVYSLRTRQVSVTPSPKRIPKKTPKKLANTPLKVLPAEILKENSPNSKELASPARVMSLRGRKVEVTPSPIKIPKKPLNPPPIISISEPITEKLPEAVPVETPVRVMSLRSRKINVTPSPQKKTPRARKAKK